MFELRAFEGYRIKDIRSSLESWRIWYEVIHDVPEEDLSGFMKHNKRILFRLCQCIAKLEAYERQIITDKYFNLKPLPKNKYSDTFWNRQQTDRELSVKYGMTKAEFMKMKYSATYKIVGLWLAI